MVGLAPEPLPTDLRQLVTRRPANPVSFVQGYYYVLVGLAPVLASDSFRAVGGPDADPWLMRAYGLAVAAVGVLLLLASRKRGAVAETARLAVGAAVVLAVADVVFVLNRAAPTVYLLDAAVQVVFVCGWLRTLLPHEPLWVGRAGPTAFA
jgi:hypothetical protein